MTKQGIIKCLGLLDKAYPNTYMKFDTDDWATTTSIWQIQFENADDLQVFAAVNECISTCDYPPSISKIKRMLLPEDDINEEEVWAIFLKAGSNGNYESEKEWNNLPGELKAISTPGTIKEIAHSKEDELPFIKKDILSAFRNKRAKQTDRLLSTKFTDSRYLPFSDVPMIEGDEKDGPF